MLVPQFYLTFWEPMDFSPPGSSVHGMLQARILELVAMPFSRADGKESAFNAGDPGSIPGWEDPLEKGMATQSICLENSMDRGAWWAKVHGVAKS